MGPGRPTDEKCILASVYTPDTDDPPIPEFKVAGHRVRGENSFSKPYRKPAVGYQERATVWKGFQQDR